MIMFDRKQTVLEKILSYIAGAIVGVDASVKCSVAKLEQARYAYEFSLSDRCNYK